MVTTVVVLVGAGLVGLLVGGAMAVVFGVLASTPDAKEE